jgi:hypothetical protein
MDDQCIRTIKGAAMILFRNIIKLISNIKSWKRPLSGSILSKAQSTIEFTFAMIVVMFLIYGMVMIFRWTGMDLANRRYTEDTTLTTMTSRDPTSELNASDDLVLPMAAVYHGNVSNGNTSQ